MVFIGSDNVMSCNAIVAPEGATFKAIETLGTCFLTVSTLHSSDVTFLNCHDIQQTVHSKVDRQVFRITAPGNLKLSATFRALLSRHVCHLFAEARSNNEGKMYESTAIFLDQ